MRALAARPTATRRWWCRPAIAPSCTSPARNPSSAVDDLLAFIAEFHQLPPEQIRPHLYSHVDHDAARHLFRVSSGLDSLVVGEPQILGQIKEAYGVASTVQTAGPLLNKLFHWAFGVGKRVRSETALAEGAVSVSFAAVSLAKKIFGNLRGRRVLVIGAGEMGKLTAVHLKAQGVASVVITSRTLAHAQELAQRGRRQRRSVGHAAAGARRIRHRDHGDGLADADSVEGAGDGRDAGEPHAAAVSHRHRGAARRRPPGGGDRAGVSLQHRRPAGDRAREPGEARRRSRPRRADRRRRGQKFATWQRSREAVPTIVALRQRFEAIRKSELERLEPKLAALPPEARARVDEITRLIVEKLLLHPTEQLKNAGDTQLASQYAEALTRLFGLDTERQKDRRQ